MDKAFQVTVVLGSYNPVYEKLERTLKSILLQDNVKLQIIVADDGSKDNCFDRVCRLFKEYGFDEYILLDSEKNNGTVSNLARTEEYIAGEYVKWISPGDYLYNKDVLREWYHFCKDSDIDVSFGGAAYYCYDENGYRPVSAYKYPQAPFLYNGDKNNQKKIILNYILLNDEIVGALFFGKKEILYKYLNRINGVIVYGEDFMYRLALIDGVRIVYYDKPVIYYEYGIGISTARDNKWINILEEEKRCVNQLICKSDEPSDRFISKIRALLRIKNKKEYTAKKYLYFPQLLYWHMRKRLNKATSRMDFDMRFMKILHNI